MAVLEKDSIGLLFARFNLRGLSSHLERLEAAAQAGSWSYRQFLRELLEAEEQLRTQRRLKRLLKRVPTAGGKNRSQFGSEAFFGPKSPSVHPVMRRSLLRVGPQRPSFWLARQRKNPLPGRPGPRIDPASPETGAVLAHFQASAAVVRG